MVSTILCLLLQLCIYISTSWGLYLFCHLSLLVSFPPHSRFSFCLFLNLRDTVNLWLVCGLCQRFYKEETHVQNAHLFLKPWGSILLFCSFNGLSFLEIHFFQPVSKNTQPFYLNRYKHTACDSSAQVQWLFFNSKRQGEASFYVALEGITNLNSFFPIKKPHHLACTFLPGKSVLIEEIKQNVCKLNEGRV